ncbi:MAG: COX15/CtaA family protein [Mucilaginibacter sp.]
MSKTTSKTRFRKINLLSTIVLFVVVLAGGVVRSTGSGMGCPDWPKCFGCLVPPTNINQLPVDYKQKYISSRVAKNQRFARLLDHFGYIDLSRRIREDKSILIPEEFNPVKTWVEYVNRLIGVLSGFFLVAVAIYSFAFWGSNKFIPVLSVFNLLLIGFQGWLGSIVVSTNLTAWIITAHLVLALALLAISIATYHLAKVQGKYKLDVNPLTHIIALFVVILSIVQIVFGAEVREKIDAIASRMQQGYRNDWVNNAGTIFFQHRDVAILVLAGNFLLYFLIRRSFNKHSIQQQVMSFALLALILQILTGIMLSYLSLPPIAQAAHVLLATMLFGAQFYLMLNLYQSVNKQEVTA